MKHESAIESAVLTRAKQRLGESGCALLRGDEQSVLDTAQSLVKTLGVLEAIPRSLEMHKITVKDGVYDKQVAAYRSLITFALSLDADPAQVVREEMGPGKPKGSMDWMKEAPKPDPKAYQDEIERRYH